MPPVRLYEGDMNVLMIMLQKLGREMDEIGSALSAITRDVSVFPSQILSHLRSKSLPARSAYTKTVLQQ